MSSKLSPALTVPWQDANTSELEPVIATAMLDAATPNKALCQGH